MSGPRIVCLEWAHLEGRRPRVAGCNARLGVHGDRAGAWLVRLTDSDGASGFGPFTCRPGELALLVGQPLSALWNPGRGTTEPGRPVDLALWDLAARREGLPVYALLARTGEPSAPIPAPPCVPCYDTSLYFDDLHLPDHASAAALLAREAREGYARGHRAFKIKVGRGARHLPLLEGTERDIAVVHAVREAVGTGCTLMLDANNGYNLNLARQVLAATAADRIYWLEEAFHEDPVLYRELKHWLAAQGLPVLIADGEGQADPRLPDWAREGLVEVLQYDIISYGLTRWLELGRSLDAWGVRAAPHGYGRPFGNYASPHLAAAIRGFTFVEWDEATVQGLEVSGYRIEEGRVSVPAAPGFGLALDEREFLRARAERGGTAGTRG